MTQERELTTADIARGAPDDTSSTENAPQRPTTVAAGNGPTSTEDQVTEPLFSPSDADRYRNEWTSVQGQFVDQPREAVEQADRLVADLMQSLAAQFSETRTGLESQWNDSDNVSTEDLRVAMTRYRSFFERLLSA